VGPHYRQTRRSGSENGNIAGLITPILQHGGSQSIRDL